MALGERGQLGTVRGDLGPQLRGPQREPVLVQDLEAPAAGGQHTAWLGRGVRPQRLAEPAAGARHGRAAPPASRDRAEMTIGFPVPAQVQCHSPGQQARLRGLARAESLQPAGGPVRRVQQSAGHRTDRVLRLDHHQPRVGLSPGVLLGPEQTEGRLGPAQGSLRLRCRQCAIGCH